jgi:hypothetical protein
MAKRLKMPILLDVGAVWCHWCHVMDEGTYSDAEVVRLVNGSFIAVKVDRDENPEVDRYYQRQVTLLTGQGGWPLTAFLSSNGEAFLGGTYFPVQDTGGMPGFRRVLKEVARVWREEPGSVDASIRGLRDALLKVQDAEKSVSREAAQLRSEVMKSIDKGYDDNNGGWGVAPKFPHPTAVSFLLFRAWHEQDESALERARLVLMKMADGGMYDQLGGGFHRYSVDSGWHIPHFEKMLGDNAYLLKDYVEGASALEEPRLVEIIRGVTDYTLNTFSQAPAAGFASSQDADNRPGDDGSYYTWSRSELKAILTPEEMKIVQWRYGINAEGQMPHDPQRNTLYLFLTPAEIASQLKVSEEEVHHRLYSAKVKMLEARKARPKPIVDHALYASLNGAMIGALSLAGRFVDNTQAIVAARSAADIFLTHAYSVRRGVAHQLTSDGGKLWGLLEDQVEFATGLLDLSEVTGEGRYLETARSIVEITLERYGVAEEGGLLQSVAPDIYEGTMRGPLSTPTFPLEDSPHISPNAAMVMALTRISALTGDLSYEERARGLLDAVLSHIPRGSLFEAGAALASWMVEVPIVRVVIEGDDSDANVLYETAVKTYHPRRVVFRGEPSPPFVLPDEVSGNLGGGAGISRALVCRGTSCLPPVTGPTELAEAIRGSVSGP